MIEESLGRRQTDPIWLQDYFLQTGHSASTSNGTATFVKRRDKVYVCTCRHILDGLKKPQLVSGARNPVLAIQINASVLNLARIGPHGVLTAFRAPARETDIVIAPLSDSYWTLLRTRKNKTAIDLDAWLEPDWPSLRWAIAAGYPDEHKEDVVVNGLEHVGSRLINAVAEITSASLTTSRIITINSALSESHSWYFSGLSGGPLYATTKDFDSEVADADMFPIGVIFEGYPSSGRPDVMQTRDATSAFLNDRDLFFRAYKLTPAIFDEWLLECGFTG